MTRTVRRVSSNKFSADLIWNAVAFALIAGIGVLLNLVIVRSYDADALGVFNQTYAVYILLSQLAVGGVHLAVQVFVPRELHARRSSNAHVSAALILTTCTSLLVIALAWWGRELPGRWFDSPGVGAAFPQVVIGLLFFSWNKVLLSFHNGARRMKLFALFQLLRFVFLLLFLTLLVIRGARPEDLPVILVWSEALLLLVLLPVSLSHWDPRSAEGLGRAVRENFHFGNRAITGNLLLDLNTRVDVFLLGVFMSDRWVGLYSFAATVAEGVMQLPMLFRNNINPILTRSWHAGGARLTSRVLHTARRVFYRILAPLALITIPLFPLGLWFLGMTDEPTTVWGVYAILIAGVALTAGYQPFQMAFNQFGRPGLQTVFIFIGFASNVLLNLLLIPALGVLGSALGTALSMVVSVIAWKLLMKRRLGIEA